MHSALPARPRPLVTSLQLVELWLYLEEEEDQRVRVHTEKTAKYTKDAKDRSN